MSNRGYTLMELIVVVILVGIAFSLAIPAVRGTIVERDLDAATRRLVGAARELKNNAVREHVDYTLHLDLNSGVYWITSADMTPEKRDEMQGKAVHLPSSVVIAEVDHSATEKQTDGEATITFFRAGYVQPAAVRLAEGERFSVLVFQPFLRKVQVRGGYEGEAAEGGGTYAELW